MDDQFGDLVGWQEVAVLPRMAGLRPPFAAGSRFGRARRCTGRITGWGPRRVPGVLAEAGLQLGHTALQRGDLLVEETVVGLELGEQGVHERPHGGGCGGPIEW